ncbi:Helitron helicase [Phytophthora megakarya]|uniref:Helitron helicase n=1 Tax=Phytophthora megakarya TaxID=4795 RepID=A0A225WF41_9STRA|nr:Helitron helicase [Phytophthora megakarya]
MTILSTDAVGLDRWTHTTRKVRTDPDQLEWCRDRFTISTQPEHNHAENPFKWITDGLFHTIIIFAKMCSSVQSVKYLYKYVYKGQDRATVVLRERGRRDGTDENNTTEERVDEIKQYLDARYVLPPEACRTIFKYEMQKNLITSTDYLSTMKANSTYISLPMLEFRMLNGPGSDFARRLLYHEISIHFVWVKMGERYVWQPRQCGGDKAIGRLISVSPRDINQSDEENHRCLLETSFFKCFANLDIYLQFCLFTSERIIGGAYAIAWEDFKRDEMNFTRSEVPNDQQSTDNTGEQPLHRRAIYLALREIHECLLANGQNLEKYIDSLSQSSQFHDVEDASDVAYRERNR